MMDLEIPHINLNPKPYPNRPKDREEALIPLFWGSVPLLEAPLKGALSISNYMKSNSSYPSSIPKVPAITRDGGP